MTDLIPGRRKKTKCECCVDYEGILVFGVDRECGKGGSKTDCSAR